MSTLQQYKRVLSVVILVFLGSLGVQAQYTYTNMTAGVGANWSTVTSWKSTNGKPADGGSSDTVIYLQAQGNADQPAMLVDIGLAANNGFMLNTLVLTNTSPNNRVFTLSGSNLVFMSNAGASPMIIGNSGSTTTGNGFTINNTIVLSNSLTIAGVDNGGGARKILGVITGVGDITNAVVNGSATGCLQVNNTANKFVGNWVLSAGIVQFAAGDGTFGSVSNGVMLMNNAQFQVSNPTTWNAARTLTIGSGGGMISAQGGNRTLTLTNTTSLAGNELLTLGANGSLTLNANQVNFTGPVQVGGSVTAGATLTLAASNALANASRIVAGNYGLVNLTNAFGAGMLTITNLANSQTTLLTNLVASGGTTLYLNDLSAVSGTDVRLNSLTSGGNLMIAPGAVPMVLHVDANGTAVPSGVNRSSLVYGITANRGNMTIGDTDANQWRGVGVGMGSATTLGAASSNLILNGNAELDALVGGTLTINSLITGGDVTQLLAIRGPGSVTLNNINNNFTSRIFGAGGTTLNANHTVGTMTFNLANTNNAFAAIQNTAAGTLVLQSGAGSNTITTLTSSGANGTMIFSGAGSVNNVAGTFQGNHAASTNTFVSGTWYFGAPGNSGSSSMGTLIINGAFVSFAGGRYWSSVGSTISLQSGTLQVLGDRFSLGADYSGNIGVNVSGGLLDVAKSGYGFSMGAGTASGGNQSITQTGGTVQYGFTLGSSPTARSLIIGASSGRTGTNTYSLAGGVLRSQFTISGNATQTASIQSRFNWTGGILVTLGMDMTTLGSSDGITTYGSGVLLNAGGALAPGDIGTAGKTTITGSYSNAPSAVLAIDIGGTKQGAAFTNAPDYYDYVAVTSNAYLVGKLNVSLINGYTPPSTKTNFTVLAVTGAGSALSGSFANVLGGKVWCSDGYSQFDVLMTAKTVVLTNYAANVWNQAGGGTWTDTANWTLATEPSNSDYAAYFGTSLAASGTVTLNDTRTVRGLTFTNSAASYTIAGAALTLQGDALTAPKISVLAGSHTISAAMVLSNATEIAVATNSVMTFTGGITGGQAVTKTGAGTLALGGANTLGSLTVSAGTVRFASDATTVSALTFATGATCDFTAGTLYILKNGGGTDTMDEVNAAITANTITLRGKSAQPIDFKVTEEDGYIKVTAKLKGTMIMVM